MTPNLKYIFWTLDSSAVLSALVWCTVNIRIFDYNVKMSTEEIFAFAGIYYSPLSKNDWTLYENLQIL